MPSLLLSSHPPVYTPNSILTSNPRTITITVTRATKVCISSYQHQPPKPLKTPTRPTGSTPNPLSSLIDIYGIDSSNKVSILGANEETEAGKNGDFEFRYDRLQFQDFVYKIGELPRSEIDELVEKVLVFGDVVEFNDMLMALVVANEHQLAVKLFSNLIRNHLKVADCGTWSIMIKCYVKMNEPGLARRVLGEMLGLGLKANVGTFTVLINAFCRRGKLQQAFEVLDVMRGIGVKPSVQTYNCVMKGLCYVGKVESAYDLLAKIKESSESPDIYSYTAVMDGFCKVGRSCEAMEFLNEAMTLGLEPSIVTYNTLLNGYVRESRPMEGIKLLKRMQEMRYQPDYISYSTLLHGLLKWGEVREALQLCREMMSIGFKVDERMMNTLLRALCRMSWKEEDLIEDVYDIFDIMQNKNYEVYPCAYSLVVQTLCIDQCVDKALVILHEMLRRELFPRMIVFNCVIRILCSQGRLDEAINVLIIIYESRRVPSILSYNVLIDGLNRERRWFDACSLYGAALKLGVVPHKKPRKTQPMKRYLFY